MNKFMLSAVAAIALSSPALAAPVDLTGWSENGFNGNGAGTWTVSTDGNSVFQSINGSPTVFFDADNDAQGSALSGTITVETTSDNDYVGFVLGYDEGELNSETADFWLIDWKQSNQSGSSGVGLALSHVSGNVDDALEGNFWAHSGVVDEVQRASSLGLTGWADNQTYTFDLVFTQDLIEVSVDGSLELSYSSADFGQSFTDGSFGFYNYSQRSVRYAGIQEVALPPIPLPAGLPLLLGGLGGLALLRKRAKA